MDFIHLHNHSDYSILDGAITVKKLVAKAVEMGMPGVAVTDHGNLFGAIELFLEATKHGIKPIIGQEFYIAPESRFKKESQSKGKDSSYHLLLLAKNETGYKNLIKLSSIGYMEGFYYRPRIDYEVLGKFKEGLICSTACLKGEVPSNIINEKPDNARRAAGKLNEMFGKGNFYLEIQDHNIPEQKIANTGLIKLSKSLDIPLVITNDCHYLNKNDSYSHDVLLCIQTGKTIDDTNRMKLSSDQFYFKSQQEMQALFPDNPDALLNTRKILDMIDLKLSLGQIILPNFDVPEGFTLDSYLKDIVYKGAAERYPNGISEIIKERIEYELKVITGMNFSGYFLIVWDFIKRAREMDIPVGPGRGSAAGSIVSYCLRITNLDPIKYNLLFERFLNPDRNEMPDIDIDFCADRREEVIDYVKNKYGENHVSQISTFNRMTAKAVLKDVARVMNVPFAEANQVTKLIPTFSTLDDTLKNVPEFKKLYKENKEWKKYIDTSRTLEGLCRSVGKHAAGVVISRGPMTEYVPLYRDSKDGSISSQFEKGNLEKAGLVKMDFLGLKNLTIIGKCLKLIKEHRGIDIDIDAIPMDDKNTFELYARGETTGLFQFESPGMKKHLRALKPNRFEDLIAMNALYRPGPMDYIPDFIKRKHGLQKIKYDLPEMEEFLKDTYGITVYQEQVMLLSQKLAGFTKGMADSLRKAMGKKIKSMMDDLKEKFVGGCIKNGHVKKVVEKIWTDWESFAQYAFNKSHSAAYAVVSYQTAYLKANYTIEYMAALLSSQPDNQEDVIQYINDCKSMGIQVLPPDINSSDYDFTVQQSSIRFGLGAIKGMGSKVIDAIITSREKFGRFNSLKEFLENIDILILNKGVLEALIKAGALDSIYPNRAALYNSIDIIIEMAKSLQIDMASGQASLFDIDNPLESEGIINLPNIDNWTNKEKLNNEKEVLGLYISGHPLEKYKDEIAELPCSYISELTEISDNSEISIAGIITNLKIKTSKNGRLFALSNIEDMSGVIEAIFFPNVYDEYSSLIESDNPLMINGKVEYEDDNAIKIIAREVKTLESARAEAISSIHIHFYTKSIDEDILKNLKSIIVRNSGNNGKCPVYFHVNYENGAKKIIKAHHAFNTLPSEKLKTEISAILGQDAVYYSHGKNI